MQKYLELQNKPWPIESTVMLRSGMLRIYRAEKKRIEWLVTLKSEGAAEWS
jgi:hypothetical protein